MCTVSILTSKTWFSMTFTHAMISKLIKGNTSKLFASWLQCINYYYKWSALHKYGCQMRPIKTSSNLISLTFLKWLMPVPHVCRSVLVVAVVAFVCSTLTGWPRTPHTNSMKSSWSTPSTKLSAVMPRSTGSVHQSRSTARCVVWPQPAGSHVVWARDTSSTWPSEAPAAPTGREIPCSPCAGSDKVIDRLRQYCTSENKKKFRKIPDLYIYVTYTPVAKSASDFCAEIIQNFIMAGCPFVIAKYFIIATVIFWHWELLNYEKQFFLFKFNYIQGSSWVKKEGGICPHRWWAISTIHGPLKNMSNISLPN